MCFISHFLPLSSVISLPVLDLWSLTLPPGSGTGNMASVEIISPFTENQSVKMTAKSQYVPQCSFVLLRLKKKERLCFFLSSRRQNRHCPLFKVKGQMDPVLWVIGLSLCFLQQQRSVGACNRAASSGLWSPPPGL